MSQISKKLRDWAHEGQGGLSFFCPGCNGAHTIKTVGPGSWGWNGDIERPTFTPSVLVTGTMKRIYQGPGDWTYERDAQGNPVPAVCHSFVTDGMIQFLGDCTHALVGQTVPLADWPEHYG